MQEILYIVGKIMFIVLIVGGVVAGISFAVQILITNILKKINKSSNANYIKIGEEKVKFCNEIINSSKIEFSELIKENKKIKNQIKRNKIRKFFKLRELKIDEKTNEYHKILLNLFVEIANVFSEKKGKNGYLRFSETQIFDIAETLLSRVENILNSTGIIWLKYLKISFFMECFSIYGTAVKFKDKILVTVFLSTINFFLKFNRLISPVAVSKYALKSIGSESVSTLISNTVISVIGKELAVIYNAKTKNNIEFLENVV